MADAPPSSPPAPYAQLHALAPALRLRGPVVRGFGRGSKSLGIPTANLDAEALAGALGDAPAGIYFGWASVGGAPAVHKMVMSVGWCVRAARGCGWGS